VHSGPEPTCHFSDVDVSKHDEFDTYEPAFRAAVVEGKAGSVMCAYNAINGQPACASEFCCRINYAASGTFKLLDVLHLDFESGPF
jgi:beta-glucosidase-like glycosyl hydrolase